MPKTKQIRKITMKPNAFNWINEANHEGIKKTAGHPKDKPEVEEPL